MSGFVVFLGGKTLPWLEVEHGRVIGRGEDFRESGVAVIAVAPASSVTYRCAAFGGLSRRVQDQQAPVKRFHRFC